MDIKIKEKDILIAAEALAIAVQNTTIDELFVHTNLDTLELVQKTEEFILEIFSENYTN